MLVCCGGIVIGKWKMDEEERRRLLYECDLSSFRKLECIRRENKGALTESKIDKIYGFGGGIEGLGWGIYNIIRANGINLQSRVDSAHKCFSLLKEEYDRLPFDKLDRDDECFTPIFEVRRLLTEVESDLEEFIAYCNNSGVDKEKIGNRLLEKIKQIQRYGVSFGVVLKEHGVRERKYEDIFGENET